MRRISLALGLVATFTLAIGLAVPSNAQSGDNPQAKFLLYGNVSDTVDPQNEDNEVVKFDTTSGAPTIMFRKVRELVRELDNQLEFKYYMENRSCGAGSPRIDLGLDTNNDGVADAFLEGHVQPNFFCPNQNVWVYQDLTDDLPRWGSRALQGGPGNAYTSWDAIEIAFGEVPVVYGMLIEDSQAFALGNRGIAYYDLVSIGDRTYDDHSDSARCSPSQECPPR